MVTSYKQLKAAKSKIFNDFSEKNIHWIFAFSEADFVKELEERKLKKEDLLSIGAGGYLKRESADEYLKLLKEINNVWDEIKDNDELLKDAFIYELGNHEYCITYDLSETLAVFNITIDEVQADERIYTILKESVKQYLSEVDY